MPRKSGFTPSAAQMALWPDISGNAVNGLGEADVDPPRPVYWHTQLPAPHAPLQQWF